MIQRFYFDAFTRHGMIRFFLAKTTLIALPYLKYLISMCALGMREGLKRKARSGDS
jgi:hypothetical protein